MAAIAAVMVHVGDVSAALDWYQRAFPAAKRDRVASPPFEFLAVGDVRLEFVPADPAVRSGAAGTVVYWHVPRLDAALDRLLGLGAIRHRGAMRIEDGLAMCQVRDPWGNCIGLRGPA